MGLVFENDLHDEFGMWPVAYIPYGGADFGEILAVGRLVGGGDDNAFHAAWTSAAERLVDEAEDALVRGRQAGARDLFLRASAFYAASFHPLYGSPVDPRLVRAYGRQRVAFERGLALGPHPARRLSIPFEGSDLPGYLVPAEGRADETRPLLILTNGYDGTLTDMYFASAVAASRRGYHCLVFDGPGQGGMLYERGVPLRPDWETVMAAVVNHAVELPGVDPGRIALNGWSLGGHLAPRAASGEPRLAACIADPAQWSIADQFRRAAIAMGIPPEAARSLGQLDQSVLNHVEAVIMADPRLRWKIVQRGFWVHGVDDLRAYFASAELFTMDGRAEMISCPTLFTCAEDDPLSTGAEAFFDALRCPKTLMRFTADEGAGGHCEMGNRSLLNRRTLDWLDEVLA